MSREATPPGAGSALDPVTTGTGGTDEGDYKFFGHIGHIEQDLLTFFEVDRESTKYFGQIIIS